MQTGFEKQNIVKFIIDLIKENEKNIDENNDIEDYNYVIDDDEWGNDF